MNILLKLLFVVQVVKAESTCKDESMMRTMGKIIKKVDYLGPGPFTTSDPFLFCVYHKDVYPPANEPLIRGNGMHFDPEAKYRMYHGKKESSFPRHPHRGFETVTAVIEGAIDHADSLGNGGRISDGDLAFMTAGKGICHCESFPRIHKDKENVNRFFQIWLNLPEKDKLVDPEYAIHWKDETLTQYKEGGATVTVWIGSFGNRATAKGVPPTHSYARDPNNDVGCFHIAIGSNGKITLPAAVSGSKAKRNLYLVEGVKMKVAGQLIERKTTGTLVELDPSADVVLEAFEEDVEVLVLQGIPIGENVVQHGPFVATSSRGIQEAFAEYQKDEFGGWPWDTDDVIFPLDKGRFFERRIVNK